MWTGDQCHTLAALPLEKSPSTHYTGCLGSLVADLYRCGRSRAPRFQNPNHPACHKQLCQRHVLNDKAGNLNVCHYFACSWRIYIHMTSSILAAHCVSSVVAFGIQRVNDHSLHFVQNKITNKNGWNIPISCITHFFNITQFFRLSWLTWIKSHGTKCLKFTMPEANQITFMLTTFTVITHTIPHNTANQFTLTTFTIIIHIISHNRAHQFM